MAWFEDDAFWEAFYPAMFGRAQWEAARGEALGALGLLGLSPGARLLDACCGPGRHVAVFAAAGMRVVGVDRTAFLLDRARDHARQCGVTAAFVQSDIRHYAPVDCFDAAVNLYTSFGYFEDAADDRGLLERLRNFLRPGGRLLMDLSGKEVVARHFQKRAWSELDDGEGYFLEERTPAGGFEKMQNRWILVRQGTTVERSFTLRMYSGTELDGLLKAAGFGKVELFGNLSGGPYDESARRLVALAER